jgi:D-aminopeptidase
VVVGNGFGKLVGVTQVRELGELETPILLTCTLCVWKAADAMVGWLLEQPGMADVRSVNAVVGETNDGYLNDIGVPPHPPGARGAVRWSRRGRGACGGGEVGAGTGTVAFGWKGGIGTSSRAAAVVARWLDGGCAGADQLRRDPDDQRRAGGQALGQYAFRDAIEAGGPDVDGGDGSIMIVVATDAPLGPRGLERLASRALTGLARTGSIMSNGSGDYVIAFSTAPDVRRRPTDGPRAIKELPNDLTSPLFQAVAEATEEAIYNSLFRATTTTGHRGTIEALPLDGALKPPAPRTRTRRSRTATHRGPQPAGHPELPGTVDHENRHHPPPHPARSARRGTGA